jgi:crotonobetainyl-CoA:carnitine CoA-transferase CaiB-like acyl-CoA transferase
LPQSASRSGFEPDERFSTHTNRAKHIDEVYAYVADVMRVRTTAEWRELLDAADIPNQPMNSPQEIIDDPHLREVGFIRAEEHPTEGLLRTMGPPTFWSGTALGDIPPAPRLGEHSAEVLRALGYADREIAALVASGATTTILPDKD